MKKKVKNKVKIFRKDLDTLSIYRNKSLVALYSINTGAYKHFTPRKPKYENEIRKFLGIKKEKIKRTKRSYKDYLKSKEWAKKRKDKIKEANNRCQLCNSPKRLEVHHRTYERIFHERLSDLIVLCHDCHETFHSKFWSEEFIESKVEELLRSQMYL